jgi:hypothetical protein
MNNGVKNTFVGILYTGLVFIPHFSLCRIEFWTLMKKYTRRIEAAEIIFQEISLEIF